MSKQLYIDFDDYIRQGEPGQQQKAANWNIAIGLQAVDGLKPSAYLVETARRNIEGEISIDEVRDLIHSYYVSKQGREQDDDSKQEADKVSTNITKILSSPTIDFSAGGYIATHRRVFSGVFKHAGKLRTYDITKREWVLNGDTVNYLNWEDLHRAIAYDIEQEKSFSYKGISSDELVIHIARFVSGLWQIHAFCEGNTRTTAVFTILYLRSIGFKADNDLFARHAWYFRNALVRANYKNAVQGIDYTPVFLERFFRNLLLGEQWVLKNRYLIIHPPAQYAEQPRLDYTSTQQVPNKYPTSTQQVPNKLDSYNPNILSLVRCIGHGEYSLRQLMQRMLLKDRPSFLSLYLTPALESGVVRMLYPDSPRHPRQRYLLTPQGQQLYAGMGASAYSQ